MLRSTPIGGRPSGTSTPSTAMADYHRRPTTPLLPSMRRLRHDPRGMLLGMDRLEDFRRVFADVVMARAESEDARLRHAFGVVPRHAFIGEPPWYFTEHGAPMASRDPAVLYQDVAM